MKIDMHCHSYYSKDGISSPESLLIWAKKKGLDGIALTDHNTTKGWNRAQKKAQELGMFLILGEEIKIKEKNKTIGEILAYFINKEIDPKNKNAEQIIQEIKNQNGIAIIAHPYHWKKPFKKLKEIKNIIDGVEIFNSRGQFKKGNELSMFFAKKNNLPMVSGSDAHTVFEIGNSYTEANTNNLNDFRKAIIEKKVSFHNKQTPPLIQIFSLIAKIFHIFKKRG